MSPQIRQPGGSSCSNSMSRLESVNLGFPRFLPFFGLGSLWAVLVDLRFEFPRILAVFRGPCLELLFPLAVHWIIQDVTV